MVVSTGAPRSHRVLSFAVARPRLDHQLDRIPPGGVGCVIAAAGSGKTVAISQWEATLPAGRWSHLDCRIEHNGLPGLFELLAQVIAAAAPETIDLLERERELDQPSDDRVHRVLSSIEDPVVLVLDDFHVISSAPLIDELAQLLLDLPLGVRIVIASRRDPAFPVHRLRLDGRFVEVRERTLAFSEAEAGQVLATVADRELTTEQIATLVERCDGWAAGLQLAALSLQSVPDVDRFVTEFAGDDRVIADYLTAEVLARQPADLRDFLLLTCILDKFTVAACEALAPDADARGMIDELERRSLFVVPLDERREWYRYHHLFADLLRYAGKAADPERTIEGHRRAAAWLTSNGDPHGAIDHLLAAGDLVEASDRIQTHGLALFERSDGGRLARWMHAVASVADRPVDGQLNLLVSLIAANEPAAATEVFRSLVQSDDLTLGERAAACAFGAGLGNFSEAPGDVIEHARIAQACLAQIDDTHVELLGVGDVASLEAVTLAMSGLAHLSLGEVETALAQTGEALVSRGASYPLWKVHGSGSAALVRACSGHLREAQQLGQTALATAAEIGNPRHVATAHSHLALALVALERDDLERCAGHLAEARQISSPAHRAANLEWHGLLSARLRAHVEGARSALAAIADDHAATNLRPLLSGERANLEARLRLSQDQPVQARQLLEHARGGLRTEPAQIELALACGKPALARQVLEGWQPEQVDLRSNLARSVWEAVVLAAEGNPGDALAVALETGAAAENEGLRRLLLDVPAFMAIIRRSTPRDPFLRSLVSSSSIGIAKGSAVAHLPDQLTERETSLLVYLPTRLSNREIAEELYLSVNTVKTHLRSIYRKLEVADRDEAVRRCEELGLI